MDAYTELVETLMHQMSHPLVAIIRIAENALRREELTL